MLKILKNLHVRQYSTLIRKKILENLLSPTNVLLFTTALLYSRF